MRIEKGRYVLYSDEWNWWITEKTVTKNGKDRETRVAGYCIKIDKLIKDFSERVTRSSDAEDLEGVLTALRDAQTDCEALLKEVVDKNREVFRIK